MGAPLIVTTWNTQWATPNTGRGHRVAAKLKATESGVIVFTEGVNELLPEGGQAVDAGADWGYAPEPDRRKVIVWTRFPLSLETVAHKGAALGRLAVAVASTPEGVVRIIGSAFPGGTHTSVPAAQMPVRGLNICITLTGSKTCWGHSTRPYPP